MPSQQEVLAIAEKWRPYRSLAPSSLFSAWPEARPLSTSRWPRSSTALLERSRSKAAISSPSLAAYPRRSPTVAGNLQVKEGRTDDADDRTGTECCDAGGNRTQECGGI